MDTKVEQEVFGYDPSDPEGLDSLHTHIHTEWPELDTDNEGIRERELTIIGAGRRHLEVSDAAELELRAAYSGEFSEHAEAMAGLTPEQRAAYKATHYLELYGTSSTSLG